MPLLLHFHDVINCILIEQHQHIHLYSLLLIVLKKLDTPIALILPSSLSSLRAATALSFVVSSSGK